MTVYKHCCISLIKMPYALDSGTVSLLRIKVFFSTRHNFTECFGEIAF